MEEVKYCISVDWLQCYCIDNHPASAELKKKDGEDSAQAEQTHRFNSGDKLQASFGEVTIKRRPYGTQLWQEVYEVCNREYEIATVCRAPRNEAIPANAVTIKLSNRVLYQQGWVGLLEELLSLLDVTYKGITRIDLCLDLNRLANGMSVPEFLMQYFSHAPFCVGHIVRNGSRKVQVQATRTMSGATIISGMRWGSSKSDVGAYCYNKTLEMLEVKEKPWIIETWKANGLVTTIDQNRWNALGYDARIKDKAQQQAARERAQQKAIDQGQAMDFVKDSVWRFELSIKGHGKDMINLRTGEIFQISPEYLSSQSMLEELFYTYAAKYFDFRWSTGQTQVKNYEKMNIFPNRPEITCKPARFSRYADTGRTEKMIANKLNVLYNKYSDISQIDMQSIRAVLSFLNGIRGMRGIRNYCDEKLVQKDIARQLRKIDTPAVDIVKLDKEFGNGYPAFVEFCRLYGFKIDPYAGYNYWKSLAEIVDEEDIRDAYPDPRLYYTTDYSPVW